MLLYRGQSDRCPTTLPDWLRDRIPEASGRWFTQLLNIALWYKEDVGENGIIVSIEIDDPEQYRVVHNPVALRFSRDGENEYLIPREIADRATPVDRGV